LLKLGGFTAFITTNSIKDGDIRKDGLEQVLAEGGEINMAVRGIKWPGRANLVVSLIVLHRGAFDGRRLLDGREVPTIDAFLEDFKNSEGPLSLSECAGMMFQGSEFLGDGFLLEAAEARAMIAGDRHLAEVIVPTLNGDEINSSPGLDPQRWIIFFRGWSLEKARTFGAAFNRVEAVVRAQRNEQSDDRAKRLWWQFKRPTTEIYSRIGELSHCFVTAVTTKHFGMVAVPTDRVLLKTLKVFTTDRWDLYAVVQSTLHEVWARKYSGALETRLRYSPSDCFETFAFPEGVWQTANPLLADIGERYHKHRKSLMLSLWLGLTDIYNLFHARDLSPAKVAKVSKKLEAEAERGYQGILELRRLHRELDLAVRDAYGWQDLDLGHDFHEVDTLPENDRVRYTINPTARKEALKHLLALNHARAKATVVATPTIRKPRAMPKKTRAAVAGPTDGLLALLSYPGTSTDEAICSAALAVVEQTKELSSMDHLDALLLTSHPQWCKSFLSAEDQRKFDNAFADAPDALLVKENDSIRWKDARDYLEQRNALEVNRSSKSQPITAGKDLVSVKASLPGGIDGVVAFALKALPRIREFRKDITTAPIELRPVLQMLVRTHEEYGIAA
jgi:hypothetical protein